MTRDYAITPSLCMSTLAMPSSSTTSKPGTINGAVSSTPIKIYIFTNQSIL